MRILTLAAAAAVVCTISAGTAFADEANLTSCVDLAQQARAALTANQQSPNYQAANKEDDYGRQFCSNSFYRQGVDHYSRALSLLGVAPSKS
jgi:hypothetical protein